MLLLCKKCAYPNLPTNDVCGRCGNVTQSPVELAQSIQSWNELPNQVRLEFEQKYRASQLKAREYGVSYKTWLAKNVVLCGVALGILTFFHNGSIFIPGAIMGALIGWYLTAHEGGSFKVMFLFGAAYFISFIFHLVFGIVKNPFSGGDPFSLFPIIVGGLAVFWVGRIVSQRITSESFDRGL